MPCLAPPIRWRTLLLGLADPLVSATLGIVTGSAEAPQHALGDGVASERIETGSRGSHRRELSGRAARRRAVSDRTFKSAHHADL